MPLESKRIAALLLSQPDESSWADAIEKLVENTELRDQMGSAAREFTMANFGVSRLVKDHEHLYKKLIAKKH